MTRMQNRLIAFTLVGLGTWLAPPAHADAASDARKVLQSLYHKMDLALTSRNPTVATASFLPDFTAVDARGQAHNLAAVRQTMQQLLLMAQTIQVTTQVQKVSLQGKTATATVHQHLVATAMDPQTHQPTRVDISEDARDLWVKTAGGWRAKRSQALTQHMSLNGKPVISPTGRQH